MIDRREGRRAFVRGWAASAPAPLLGGEGTVPGKDLFVSTERIDAPVVARDDPGVPVAALKAGRSLQRFDFSLQQAWFFVGELVEEAQAAAEDLLRATCRAAPLDRLDAVQAVVEELTANLLAVCRSEPLAEEVAAANQDLCEGVENTPPPEVRRELLWSAFGGMERLREAIAGALGGRAVLAFDLGRVIEQGASRQDIHRFLDPDGPTHPGVGATLAARTRRRGEVGPDPAWPERLRRHWAESRLPGTALDEVLSGESDPKGPVSAEVVDALHAAAGKELGCAGADETPSLASEGPGGPVRFRLDGENWRLRFTHETGVEEGSFPRCGWKGLTYLRHLVEHAGEWFTAVELHALAGKRRPGKGAVKGLLPAQEAGEDPDEESPPAQEADEDSDEDSEGESAPEWAIMRVGFGRQVRCDPEAIQAVLKARETLKEELAMAEAEGERTRAEECETKLEQIKEYLNRGIRPGRRLRHFTDDLPLEKARKSVGFTMRYAMERLAETMPALAAHLGQALKGEGVGFAYRPAELTRGRADGADREPVPEQ